MNVMKSGIPINKYIALTLYIYLLFPTQTPLTYTSSRIPVCNFNIVSFRGEWQNGTFYVIGEIKNVGAIPGGPKVEVIARDSEGLLIARQQFWPNSVHNILPGNSCGIRFHITEDSRAETIEIKVVGVNKWD